MQRLPLETFFPANPMQGILQAMSPFVLRYLSGRPTHRKPLMWSGMLLVVASSVGAAFSGTVSKVDRYKG